MVRIIDEHLVGVIQKNELLWDMVKEAYLKVLEAFENDNRKLALKVAKNDKKINDLEEEINEDTIRTITLQSPVASDLRLLISSLKIANQLERIADYTVNIADHILIGDENSDETYATIVDSYIVEMIQFVVSMLDVAKDAYVEQDISIAKKVIEMDRQLDKIYRKSMNKLIHNVGEKLVEEDELATVNLNSILIVKYMERAGDHIVNIAESVFFMVKGRNYDIHHHDDGSDDDM